MDPGMIIAFVFLAGIVGSGLYFVRKSNRTWDEIFHRAAKLNTRDFAAFAVSKQAPEKTVGVKCAIIWFLSTINYPDLEAFLQRELNPENGNLEEYRRECILALGKTGTQTSLSFLHQLRQDKLDKEINEAMAAIRERTGAKDSGMLSLDQAGEEEGSLSISEDDPPGSPST